MKKVIIIFVLVFVAGIAAGGAYEWLSDRGIESVWGNSTNAVDAKAKPSSQPESAVEGQASEKAHSSQEEQRVTNPNKICATPGCGRAVFVTYKGQELCVKCYGEAKNRGAAYE